MKTICIILSLLGLSKLSSIFAVFHLIRATREGTYRAKAYSEGLV